MPDRARASAPVASTSASTRCMKGQQGGAVGREGDRALARAPVEEHDAELVLEQADLAGERGLRQVQPGGGLREALFLGHGQGIGQLVELHESELIALIFMLFMSLTCLWVDPRVAASCGNDVCRRGRH